jgi:hypothetical protein
MPRQSHLSQLSPTFPQVWIEPVGKPVYNLRMSGESSPVYVPHSVKNVPYPHQWTACGQLFGCGERHLTNWGQVSDELWMDAAFVSVIHTWSDLIPRSSPSPVDDPTLGDLGKQPSSPVSTGPTTTTTSITQGGIKNHRVMQQSSPHLPALRSKGEAQ